MYGRAWLVLFWTARMESRPRWCHRTTSLAAGIMPQALFRLAHLVDSSIPTAQRMQMVLSPRPRAEAKPLISAMDCGSIMVWWITRLSAAPGRTLVIAARGVSTCPLMRRSRLRPSGRAFRTSPRRQRRRNGGTGAVSPRYSPISVMQINGDSRGEPRGFFCWRLSAATGRTLVIAARGMST